MDDDLMNKQIEINSDSPAAKNAKSNQVQKENTNLTLEEIFQDQVTLNNNLETRNF